MSVSIFDIINNVSSAGWVIVTGSSLAVVFWAIIFWQDIKNRSSKFFLLFSFVVFMWGSASVFFNASIGTPFIYKAVTILYFIAGFVAPTLFLAIDAFSNRESRSPFKKFAIIFGPYFLLSLGFLKPGLIVGYEHFAGATDGRIVFGKFFSIYIFYSVILVALGVRNLVKKYQESAGIFRHEMRDFLITFIVAASVALAGTLFSPIFTKNQDFFWIGYIGGALPFLVISGLIFIKYSFLNIKVIATELFISTIVFVLIAELFLAGSPADLVIKTSITIIIIFSSSFLIGSVRREIQSKERITELLVDLDRISRRLKVLDKKKSEFLSIASHHLRDPLTVIKGYSSMLLEGSFGEISQSVKESIEKIYTSSGHLITMISDFMDISRIESGNMKYVFADVDVKKLVVDLADEMKQNADRSHLAFSVNVDDTTTVGGELFVTVGDAGKLRQVFSNLIDNSIKYTPKGNVSVLLKKSHDGKKIIFNVFDTGIGMSENTLGKIFKKFSRADGVSKVYTEGTGLGLYVAAEIIKKHEGRIWAESEGEGHGSSFFVELDAKR
ncbi:sensor histidine kinase [Patescibacteria group bacterium]|nr:MAG: sensor histidine kinase [Patescibacteria group bacterium]